MDRNCNAGNPLRNIWLRGFRAREYVGLTRSYGNPVIKKEDDNMAIHNNYYRERVCNKLNEQRCDEARQPSPPAADSHTLKP